MKKFFEKFKSLIYGLGLSLISLLITYLIFGLIQKNFYLWGVIHLLLSLGFFLLGWFSAGMINRNIRRNEGDRLADTSYKNPKKAEYKVFLHTCYYACLFGVIINVIGFYAFGLGKFVPEVIMLF